MLSFDCAAHDALQNRDLTERQRLPTPSLGRSRISGAPRPRMQSSLTRRWQGASRYTASGTPIR